MNKSFTDFKKKITIEMPYPHVYKANNTPE